MARLPACNQLSAPRITAALGLVALLCASAPAAGEPSLAEFTPAQLAFFESEVRPLLAEHCLECHGRTSSVKGGLRLTSRSALVAGGDSGPAFAAEQPEQSLLLEAINYETYEMPPSGKLPPAKIELLTRWIRMGAPWPRPLDEEAGAASGHDEPGPPPVDETAKRFWSFQRVQRPEVPAVKSSWISSPIDAFILQRLESAQLAPARPASKTQLLRRAYYDLTGLPPSPSDVRDFLADDSPGAFERVVDRLLESPQYGERWGRHWLDLVRYAESNSYERDDPKPHVWRYRDYVIRAFNDDKPYTEFVLQQLAGDELPNADAESIVATGYYRLGIWQDEPVDAEQELFEDLDDFVRTTGEAFLGLTAGCARCHDHKLDPIPQRDYYRFLAFFRNVRRYGVRSPESVAEASLRPIGSLDQQQQYKQQVAAHRSALQQNRRGLRAYDQLLRETLVGVERDDWQTEAARLEIAKQRVGSVLTAAEFDEYVALSRQRDELRKFTPPGLDQALCVKEHGRESPETYVLVRGNAHVHGPQVDPGFPEVLSPPETEIVPPPAGVPSTGRRLALAKWIASPANPLTARVFMNRVWQHHFGRGLVRSASDFGFRGDPPTHPQLLDWLAADFMAGGWRLKRMHKQIMLSSAYRMSSTSNDEALAADPTNDLLWRFNMRRLTAEEIRDSILAVNGQLNRSAMFGPSIYAKIPAQVLAGQSRPGHGWGESPQRQRARRAIYIHVKRSLAVPLLASFDGPDTDASCPVRFSTTQPTQSLTMLNSEFVHEQAQEFAEYLLEHGGDSAAQNVALALRRTLQREPEAHEIRRGQELVASLRGGYGLSLRDALTQFCVTMFNLNEFMYLD